MIINNLPQIGEKIIVNNIRYAEAKVSDILWKPSESRFIIEVSWNDLDGKDLGKSKVHDHDQNKSWFRVVNNN